MDRSYDDEGRRGVNGSERHRRGGTAAQSDIDVKARRVKSGVDLKERSRQLDG
jgi:hypothetical protein